MRKKSFYLFLASLWNFLYTVGSKSLTEGKRKEVGKKNTALGQFFKQLSSIALMESWSILWHLKELVRAACSQR